jgi:hypothetical protein
MKWIVATVAALLSCGVAHHCHAQLLASRSFDLLFQGDDPSERYDFLLSTDPLVPVTVRFEGFFENLSTEETGVRYGIGWYLGNHNWDGRQFTDEMGLRLPGADPLWGTTRVPFGFAQRIDFTPSETQFWVEGLGGTDRFRFIGEFAIQAVPEPTVLTQLIGAAFAGLYHWLRMKRKNHAI